MPDSKGKLNEAAANVIMQSGAESDFEFISKRYDEMPASQEKFQATAAYCNYLTKLNDISKIKKGIDKVIAFRNQIPESYRSFTDPVIKEALGYIAEAKGDEIAGYIKSTFK